MIPPKRKASAVGSEGNSENIATGPEATSILQGGDVPAVRQHATNPTDITLAILRKTAAAFGLSLSAKCRRCGATLSADRSLKAKLGPTCRRRQAVA